MRHNAIVLILVTFTLTACVSGDNPPTTTTTIEPTTTSEVATSTVPEQTTTTTDPAAESVTFIAAGDIGGRDDPAGTVLRAMAEPESDFLLILGDLSYEQIVPEAAWCDWVEGFFPTDHPIEIVAGNHEDDERADGFIREFTACLPDRMGAVGDYGVEYYFDAGPVRVIMVAAALSVDGTAYRYDTPGPHRDWLLARVDEAEAAGLWTVIGMHKVCVSAGDKGCEIGESTIDRLIAHGADLILHGHDHNYQRSHQLHCIDAGTTTMSCIGDTDAAHRAGAGAVIVVTGWVGQPGYNVSSSDGEAGYFSVIGGPNTDGWGPGYLTVTVTSTTLTGTWTTPGSAISDTFTIERAG